jgi:hypothetical protein
MSKTGSKASCLYARGIEKLYVINIYINIRHPVLSFGDETKPVAKMRLYLVGGLEHEFHFPYTGKNNPN